MNALDPARSFSVTASAGSGKTHTLVSRIVRLLLAGADPGGIVAVTFTRKAAAEMRERVDQRLFELARAGKDDLDRMLAALGIEPDDEVRARARGLHETMLFARFPLRAMTLHAFCQDLLSRFALEAGVHPQFALVDSEPLLLRQVWRRLQEALAADPACAAAEALRELARAGHDEEDLRRIVLEFLERRSDWWAFVEDAADPLESATRVLNRHLGVAPDGNPLAALDGKAFTAELTVLCRWFQRTGRIGRIEPEALWQALALRGQVRYDALVGALLRQNGEPYVLKVTRDLQVRFSEAELGHLELKHAEVLRAVAGARESLQRETCRRNTIAAWTLGVAALDLLDRELAGARLLTYSDLEWRTCRLLQDPEQAEWVRYRLDQKVDHLLVDEFQDTNPTQWRLLKPLLEEIAAGEAGRARSVFVVGDPKQSIYGFRRANPELLEDVSRYIETDLRGARASLTVSWRSAPAVISFVNELFSPPDLGRLIGFGRHETHRQQDWGRVEVAPIIPYVKERPEAGATLRDPLVQPRPDPEDNRAVLEARQVAQRIAALVENGVGVAERDGGPRAIAYDDVVILARTRTHLAVLERALMETGIPFVGAARGTLLDTVEGADLWALLRFLNSPERDLDLAHVLRSPLFAAPEDVLSRLAQDVVARGGHWFDSLRRLAAAAAPDDPRAAELQRASRLLDRWQELARRVPAHDLLDRVLAEGDVAGRYEAALPAALRARVRPNLGAFVQLALEADHGRYPTLARFIEFLRAQDDLGDDAPDEAPAALAGHLRIMTIHAAKGLESPAVFIVNAGALPKSRNAAWRVEWPHGARRPTHFMLDVPEKRRTALHRELAAGQDARDAREELNLLYVAATRARQFLHVSGFEPGNAGKRLSWHDHALRTLQDLGPGTGKPLPGAVAGALSFGSGEVPLGLRAAAAPAADSPDERLRQPLVEVPPETAPAPAREETDPEAARRGTAIHALLEVLSEDAAAADPALRAALGAAVGSFDDAEFPAWAAEARGVVAAPGLARFFGPAGAPRAWNEVPLLYEGPDGAVPGVIDRLVDDGEVLWVLDYKTHRKPDADALRRAYAPQLERYVAGVRKLWPDRAVRAGLVLTETKAWVPAES